jgi:hypothetical protein
LVESHEFFSIKIYLLAQLGNVLLVRLGLKVAPKLAFELLFIKTQLFVAFLHVQLNNDGFLVGFEKFEDVFSYIEVGYQFYRLIEEFEQKVIFFFLYLELVQMEFFIFFGFLAQFFGFMVAKFGLYLLLLLTLVVCLLILRIFFLKYS